MGPASSAKITSAPAPFRRFGGRFAIAILACVALGVTAAQSGAQSIDELNSQIDAAKQEAQALGAQIDATSNELAAAQQRAITAAQREAELNSLLAKAQAEERRLQVAVADAQARLVAARHQLGRSRNALSNRLVDIYRSGMPDTATLILDSDGFDDLATRAEYLKRIEEADASLVDRVRTTRDAVADRLAEVQKAEARASEHSAKVEAARDEIAAVRASAEADAAHLEALRAQRQAAIETLQSKVGEWTEQVQKLERISERQAQSEVQQWFGDWAIPYAIVMCESGGDFTAVNPSSGAGGAYQILPSTWHLYGGHGLPQDASPAEQSRIAAMIWADSGASAWECAQ
jgi:septal ring factor EnvC (AmiA/AmiB activator)